MNPVDTPLVCLWRYNFAATGLWACRRRGGHVGAHEMRTVFSDHTCVWAIGHNIHASFDPSENFYAGKPIYGHSNLLLDEATSKEVDRSMRMIMLLNSPHPSNRTHPYWETMRKRAIMLMESVDGR